MFAFTLPSLECPSILCYYVSLAGNKDDRRRAYQAEGRRPSLPVLELGTIPEQREKSAVRKNSNDAMSWSHQQQYPRRHRPSLVDWSQGDVVMVSVLSLTLRYNIKDGGSR